MEQTAENDIKIADYLEDRLTPEGEAAFMLELAGDADLREQFENELSIRALLDGQAAPVIRLFTPRLIAAAAVVILGSLTFIWITKQGEGERPSHLAGVPVPPVKSQDDLFAKYYRPYTTGVADPVELSLYYRAYEHKRYPEVLSAKESDYEVMGADDTNILLKRYMQFYKGLSYLGMREPDKAIALFDSLQGVPPLRDRADWYLAMAWLMKKDFQKAGEITQKIAQTDSPFRLPAAQLLKESPFQP